MDENKPEESTEPADAQPPKKKPIFDGVYGGMVKTAQDISEAVKIFVFGCAVLAGIAFAIWLGFKFFSTFGIMGAIALLLLLILLK